METLIHPAARLVPKFCGPPKKVVLVLWMMLQKHLGWQTASATDKADDSAKPRYLWVQGSPFTLKGLYVGEGLPSSTRMRSSERLQSKMFRMNISSQGRSNILLYFMHCKTTQTRVSSESQFLSKKWIKVWPGLNMAPSTCIAAENLNPKHRQAGVPNLQICLALLP